MYYSSLLVINLQSSLNAGPNREEIILVAVVHTLGDS